MPKDPTIAMRKKAASLSDVTEGTSCNQSSYKIGKGSFFFVGPGTKGEGFKAMFRVEGSLAQAQKLADKEPERFSAGSNGWVTVRFTAEKPIPKTVWEKWLKEAHGLRAAGKKTPAKAAKKKATRKKTTKRS